MEITGKIIKAFDEISGVSKAGNSWKKREYVLETLEQYPRKVLFDFFGERADQYPLKVGDTITLSFDIESREYQDRWYTSIRGWKAVPADANGTPVQQPQQQYQQPQQQYQQPAPQYQQPAPQYQQPAPQQQGYQQAPQQQGYQQPQTPGPDIQSAPGGDDLPF